MAKKKEEIIEKVAKPKATKTDNKENNGKIPVIEVINFSKKYRGNKNYSVKDANFSVYRGEFHGFVGANGAGKTTTIKSIIGAYAKYEGNVKLMGIENHKRAAKEKLGYIPEAADFPSGFSTISYLKNMAMLAKMSTSDANKFAYKTLEDLGLTDIAKRSPNKLSSGQKKKVLLAQALIHKPEIIIMDEPAANLDPQARKEFFSTLKRLAADEGVTIFISSHILDELQKYIDSVTIVDGGKIVYSGEVNKIGVEGTNTKLPTWVLRTFDIPATEKLLTKMKISYIVEGIFIELKATKDQIAKLILALGKEKISMSSLLVKGTDLASVYDRFVQQGSLDVKKGGA